MDALRLMAAALACLAATFVRAAEAAPVAIDFSSAGYGGGGVALPEVPAKFVVTPSGGDDTRLVQAALDAVGRMPLDARRLRGTVLLRGTFRIEGQLRLDASGVVLRGENATLVAAGKSRRTLIEIRGRSERTVGPAIRVADETVPAGAASMTLENVDGLGAGTRVLVRRPSTREWIAAVGANNFPGPGQYKEMRLDWVPGSRDIEWERTILAVDAVARRVTLDAPLTTALETKFGGGTLHTVAWPDRPRNIGVEDLLCISDVDAANPHDEEHAWMAVAVADAENVWVRRVTARRFVSSCVWVARTARAVTIEDCASAEPVSELGAWRRVSFYVGGQQVLVQRCTAEDGGRDFAAGHCAAGLIVFLECQARRAHADSGPFESWASGVLYDRVSVAGAGLGLANLGAKTQGAAWTAANCVLWNCAAASRMDIDQPPGAPNRAIVDASTPSLYRAQLDRRLGTAAVAAHRTTKPAPAAANIPPFTGPVPAPKPATVQPVTIAGGWFVVNGRALFGSAQESSMWRGQLIPGRERELGTSPTRWAPGRSGPGLTEDLDALTSAMAARGASSYWAYPGLWYDRRRDDHAIVRRDDGEAAGPYFEEPWARSGQGHAWDGLSRYDLTKFNPWYFARMREMADACAAKGLLFVCELYNNHNTLEAAAHWADFPWRPANAIQDTGFPEPPQWEGAGQSRHHIADAFYDPTHPVRRNLHELYIRHTLDALADSPNFFLTVGHEFAGPLPFQQFVIDTVAAWEKTQGRRVRLVLQTSKAITDAILTDPARAAHIDVVDTRWWQFTPDGKLFAPDGLGKQAFREIRNNTFGREVPVPTTAESVYRIVREYRDKAPGKAILAGNGGFGPLPILMAGGAMSVSTPGGVGRAGGSRDDAALLRFVAEHVADALPRMRPVDGFANGAWCLADETRTLALIYSAIGAAISLAQPLGPMEAMWFSPQTGETKNARLDATTTIEKPSAAPWLLLAGSPER